jgi:hypothetical protein
MDYRSQYHAKRQAMPKHIVIIILVFAVMAGCASAPQQQSKPETSQQPKWVKPGFTSEQFNRDHYACVQESQTYYGYGGSFASGFVAGWLAQKQANQLYDLCMKARGYTLSREPIGTPVPPSPPAGACLDLHTVGHTSLGPLHPTPTPP